MKKETKKDITEEIQEQIKAVLSAKLGEEMQQRVLDAAGEYSKKLQEEETSPCGDAPAFEIAIRMLALDGALRENGVTDKMKETLYYGFIANYGGMLADQLKDLSAMPFFFSNCRKQAKKQMAEYFPKSGFEIKDYKATGKLIHFKVTRCLYYDFFKAHGCEELTPFICMFENRVLLGAGEKVQFSRKETLPEGGTCCDFCFKAR